MADETQTTDQTVEVEQAPANIEAQTEQPAQTAETVIAPEAELKGVESTTDDNGVVEYAPSGNAALDVTLTFIGSLGITGDDPAMQAAAKGDFSILEAKLATLGDKARGWQQMIELGKSVYKDAEARRTEQVKRTDAAILSVVQSTENWNEIKSWAAKNATPEEKAELNRMVDAGPVQARAAATLLLEAYRKASGTAVNPRSPLSPNASPAAAVSEGPLSPREYSQAVAKLRAELGTRMESSPQYRALRSRLAR